MILYIANRAEIARRIMKTAKQMGFTTCVGYSRVDEELPFVREASRSLCLDDGSDPRSAYLDISKVVSAAKSMGATHLHPGYGFLSENAQFAEAVEEAGIRFVGPRPETMRSLGDKMASREFVRKLGVPLLPSYEESSRDDARLEAEAEKMGFPVLVKPSAGGGGKGMSVARASNEVRAAVESARRVAAASFKDDRLYLERYLETARHIEVQIIGDGRGKVWSFGERECSLQRRYQKLVEETPCLFLPQKLREKISDYSRKIGEAAKYRSAGTIEWIWDGADQIYFLEVNSRLQVEHPVTEEVFGIDLVELQLKEALDQKIELKDLQPTGHAIELRLCAEDPAKDYMPSGGKIYRLDLPEEIRVDFGYSQGNEVGAAFDSMLGKLICHANDRESCIDQLIAALEKTILLGPATNRAYLLQLLKDERVRRGELSTNLLAKIPYRFDAVSALLELTRKQKEHVPQTEDEDLDYYSPWGATHQRRSDAFYEDYGERRFYFLPFADWSERIQKKKRAEGSSENSENIETDIRTPMPGKIIQVKVSPGEIVEKGAVLLILEAMKMEHQVRASAKARVAKVHVTNAQQVLPDDRLVELELIS